MSLYVQLSRAEKWEGLYLFRKPARANFIEPKNVLGRDMRDVVVRLERMGEETRRRFERDHRRESWFQDWNAMPETTGGADAADKEDTSMVPLT
jgi:ATP-dependent DNA helicase PIF1